MRLRTRSPRSAMFGLSAVAGLILCAGARAAEGDGIEFFEKKIRPILVEHCYSCHSEQAGKRKGGFVLDSRDGLRKGGDAGPALVPGRPEQSRLIRAVKHTTDDLKMPPKGKLSDAAIADLEAWVKLGAPDPRERAATPSAARWEDVLRSRRQWWSLQPLKKPGVPKVKHADGAPQPIDAFLLARLETAGIVPAASADRRTLIRRLSVVLTGLLPSPEEVEAFAADPAPDAYEKLVDRLLASPHFGERWARHWLDVVRFTETHGNEWNYEVHHAWQYRDYLIRAFNDDIPYDRFVREHIAGDLLPPRWNRKEKFNEAPIGTAFYRFGEVNHDDCIEFRQIGYDLLDNQIDTLSKAFQGTTVACARCHDHKLDAVSMKDYYALLGILRSSRPVSHTLDGPEVNAETMRRLRELKAPIQKEIAALWREDAKEVSRYFKAAQAARDKRSDAPELAKDLDPKRLEQMSAVLKPEKFALEDPTHAWRTLHAKTGDGFAEAWQALAAQVAKEQRERAEFNAKHFTPFGDFRTGQLGDWKASGLGLRDGVGKSGDFVIAGEGDAAVSGLLPAGFFTHAVSERLNGALRSPVLSGKQKFLSVQVLGGRQSAVRLVSNHCQLNYKNYRALRTPELIWVTFPVPDDGAALRCYAELMTKFDNPKFPDQLGTLGGDDINLRVPWEQAAADPRSFFGVTRAVLHDCAESPKDELTHLRPLFAGSAPKSADELAERYSAVAATAVAAWAEGRATDDDVRWLNWLLRHGLLRNTVKTSGVDALVAQYRAVEKTLSLPRIVPGLADVDGGADQAMFARGDARKPGELVGRRYLEVLDRPDHAFRPRGSGRLELAERIASADNPLTARVMVNRVWHHLFGAGIARTTDDFGHVGDMPSHPELLDYLAVRFIEEGWSVKKLIRMIVLTRTFQMSSRPGSVADPENRLLHHFPARRMEAEAIRDSILTASGRLDLARFGPSIQPYRDKANTDRRLFPGPLDGNGRRSLYIKANLMEGPKFLSAFNFPGGKVAQGRRDVTNVPAQALALMNDPFVLQQADVWATKLVTRPDASPQARLEHMFRVALARAPEKEEAERFVQAVGQITELHGVPKEDVLKSRAVWKDIAHTVFNMKEFIYIR